MQTVSAIVGVHSMYTFYSKFSHEIQPYIPGYSSMTLSDLICIVNYWDLEQTVQTLKNNTSKDIEINECLQILSVLLESFNKLCRVYSKMWILSNYRIGDVTNIAKDLIIWNNKLMIRLKLLNIKKPTCVT